MTVSERAVLVSTTRLLVLIANLAAKTLPPWAVTKDDRQQLHEGILSVTNAVNTLAGEP